MRLSFTRGACSAIVPDPTVTRRSRARPLRTTSRLPSSSRSSAKRSTYSPTSASSAAAIIHRAPSRASSSNVTAISSLPSPIGSLRTSSMACLPLPPHGGRSLSTGKVRRLPLQAHPQLPGIAQVKVRPVTINVAGDHWTFDKYDRYGNLVGHGALVDGRNRSWGRQVTEVAYELERFIFSRGVLTSVRSAVVVLHDRARLGSIDDLRVDLLCVGPEPLLERLHEAAPALDAEQRTKTVSMVRRDHAFHAQRRLQRSKPGSH